MGIFTSTSVEGVLPDKDSPDVSTLKENLSKAGKRGGEKLREKVELQRETAEINALFEAENWKELASLYFKGRFVVTGYRGFLLSPEQEKILSVTLATSMKSLLKIDPAYIALIVLTTNMSALIVEKEFSYRQARRQGQRAQEPSAPEPVATNPLDDAPA